MNSGGNEPRTRRDWIDQRRKELRITMEELALLADRSREGLRLILNGTSTPTAKTVRRIEAALQWASGSWEDIAAGKPPSPLTVIDVRTASPEEVADAVADMAEHLSDAELLEAVTRVLQIRQNRRLQVGHQPD